MEDILIMKRCSYCRKHLTLRESQRMSEDGSEGLFLVEYCSFCGSHPVTEIVQLADLDSKVDVVAVEQDPPKKKIPKKRIQKKRKRKVIDG